MNDSTLWWDGLEGNNLACRPRNKSENEFALACLVLTRIMPTILFGSGISFIFMAWLQFKFSRKVQPGNLDSNNNCPAPATTPVSRKITAPKGNHGAIFALVIGIGYSFTSLSFFINGHGTIFGSETLPGRIGDACFAIHHCTLWYLALIQVRGANWFMGLVQLPTGIDNETENNCFRVLNSLQGPLGPLIALILWLLLTAGVLPRGWFYFVGLTLTAIFSFRAFVVVATQRVSALRKVALMQNEIPGSPEDTARRQGILRSKTFALLIDLASVFLVNVVSPASLVVLRSTFSSRQLVVHCAIMLTFISIATWFVVVHMVVRVIRARKLQHGKHIRALQYNAGENISQSQLSGNSVVNQSAFLVNTSGYVRNNAREKLFTQGSSTI